MKWRESAEKNSSASSLNSKISIISYRYEVKRRAPTAAGTAGSGASAMEWKEKCRKEEQWQQPEQQQQNYQLSCSGKKDTTNKGSGQY